MITTTSLVTIPMQSYYSIIGHIPYAIYYIPMAYLSYNWNIYLLIPSPVSPTPHHPSPLAATCLFSVSMSLFLLHFICFLDST